MQTRNYKTSAGISFIEILVVLLLMSLAMSFVIPRFLSSQHGRAKKQFFSEFSALVSGCLYQAVTTKKIHQIFWDIDHHEVLAKTFDEKSEEKNKHNQFKLAIDSPKNKIKIPEQFVIHNFFIQDDDRIKAGETMHTAWTYIMPDGTSQQLIVNMQDEEEQSSNRFSIKINPFYSQVSLHDAFEKP